MYMRSCGGRRGNVSGKRCSMQHIIPTACRPGQLRCALLVHSLEGDQRCGGL